MQPDLASEVRSFVVATFLWGQGERLRDDASFLEEGIIDSTGILQLVSFMEEKFGITVEDHELIPENLDSVNKAVAYMRAKLNGKLACSPATEMSVASQQP